MARGQLRTAPPKNDVYFGMLLLTVVAMLLGTVLLALETNEYEWVSEPQGGPAISLPQAVTPRVYGGEGQPMSSLPAEPNLAQEQPAPEPEAEPAVAAEPKLKPEPKTAVAVKKPEPEPAEIEVIDDRANEVNGNEDRGPQPGFYLNVPGTTTRPKR